MDEHKTSEILSAFNLAHSLDARRGFIVLDGTRYENDRIYIMHLTPQGRHSLKPHCFRCVQGQPVVNLFVNGETGDGSWNYLTIVPKYPCKRGYQGKEQICIKAIHSSWLTLTLDDPRPIK